MTYLKVKHIDDDLHDAGLSLDSILGELQKISVGGATSSIDTYGIGVRSGTVDGFSPVSISGYIDDLRARESLIFPQTAVGLGVFDYVVNLSGTAQTWWLYSTSAEDDGDIKSPGDGAQVVTVTGIKSNGEEVEDDVSMGGTSTVATNIQFKNINSIRVKTAGSSGGNEGNIYLVDTASADYNVQWTIIKDRELPLGTSNQGYGSLYMVPQDREFYPTNIELSSNVANAAQEITIRVYRHSPGGLLYNIATTIIGQAGVHGVNLPGMTKLVEGDIFFVTAAVTASLGPLKCNLMIQGFLKDVTPAP